MHRVAISLLLGAALFAGASAASPSRPARAPVSALLPLGSCQGGAHDGKPCLADVDCEDPAVPAEVCTTELADVAVRGVLTLIADKDSGGFDDTSAVPQQKDAFGTPIPLDLTKSTLTVMLEFTRNGEKHVLTETYKDLGDYADPALLIDCKGFCVPTWREPAVEARIASSDRRATTTGPAAVGAAARAAAAASRRAATASASSGRRAARRCSTR